MLGDETSSEKMERNFNRAPSLLSQGDAQPLPSCPLCRKPVTGLYRYGRPLKKRALDIAERKYVQQCTTSLDTAHAALQRGRTAYAELNADEGELMKKTLDSAHF